MQGIQAPKSASIRVSQRSKSGEISRLLLLSWRVATADRIEIGQQRLGVRHRVMAGR